MIIYKATNRLNGKVYIGQTIKTLKYRKGRHIYESNNGCDFYLHRAVRKYGIDNFKWEVICICPNIDSLNEQEEYYIAFYDSMNSGYNLQSGGKNRLHSDATKQKMSKTATGANNPMYGKHPTEETRQKIIKALIDRECSEETRKRLRENHVGMLGRDHTEATKQKMSENSPKYWLGKKRSKKTKKNMSIAQLKRFEREKRTAIQPIQLNMF